MGRRAAIAAALALAGACGRHEPAPAAAEVEHSVSAGPVEVRLRAEPARITVADRLTLTLTARAAPGASLVWPEVRGSLGGFTVVGRRQSPATMRPDGGVVEQRTLVLEPFLAGEYEVPALRVEYADGSGGGSVATPPFTVAVESVLGEGEPEVAPARGLFRERGAGWWPLASGLLAAAGVGLAGVVVVRARRGRAGAGPAPGPSAEAELARIAQDGGGAEALARVGPLVRSVLAPAAVPGAGAMTTEELASHAAARSLPPVDQAALRRSLEASDAARFGGASAEEEQVRAGAAGALAAVRILLARAPGGDGAGTAAGPRRAAGGGPG